MSTRLLCPECGECLYSKLLIDDKTGELVIDIYCEGDSDDEFELQILTGLTENDVDFFDKIGEIITKQMKVILNKRIAESC